TLVLPFPVELLRFLERAQSGQPPAVAQPQPQPQSQSQAESESESEPKRTPGASPAVERQPGTEPE
ncbi:slipin family protein, partial [Streptomyces sp. DT193]